LFLSGAKQPHLLVDIFAGPGGLGEGFLSHRDTRATCFKSALSIEKDHSAHETLTLRHFLRAFVRDGFPENYYDYLAEKLALNELYAAHPDQHASALASARKITLGPDSRAEVRVLLRQRLSRSGRWALVGGPPCQAYSLVGRSRRINDPRFAKDEKHFLYKEYLRIIADHHPPIFVMENVKGLLSAKLEGASTVNRIVTDLQDPSMALHGKTDGVTYRLFSLTEEEEPGDEVDPRMFIVRAEDFGVPQARHRMFIVGVRDDLNIRPRRLQSATAPSVQAMIGGLPRIRSRLSKEPDSAASWRAAIAQIDMDDVSQHLNGAEFTGKVVETLKASTGEGAEFPLHSKATSFSPGRPSNAVSMVHDPNLHTLVGHETRSHMASDLRRYMFAAAFSQVTGRSPKLADFPASLLPAHGNVDEGVAGDTFADRFRVQLPDRVSTTVTSHISKDGHYFIHYDPMQCRSLTVREAARLQTFPDNYKFLGNRTSQYHQVGNAVPPHLAAQIADIVADVLDRMKDDP
jgi:DNA (cytosine-5)-methyltransferase 1